MFQVQYHEVLPTEDDPEGEQHWVEDALSDVSKKQHPGPIEANRKPLDWDVDECHWDTQSEDYPKKMNTCINIILVLIFLNFFLKVSTVAVLWQMKFRAILTDSFTQICATSFTDTINVLQQHNINNDWRRLIRSQDID